MAVKLMVGWCFALAMAALPAQALAQADTITFGAIYNVSGAQAALDGPSLNGARLAAEVINNAGGVAGQRVALAISEGDSVPGAWPVRIDELAGTNQDLAAYFGLSDTDNVIAAASAAAELRIPFLTSGATAPLLPERVPTYLFLACFGDNVQAAAGAEWAYNSAALRKAHVLFDPSQTYPVVLKEYFAEGFAALGGDIAEVDEVDPQNAEQQVSIGSDVHLVFLSVETAQDAVRMIPLIRAAGYDGLILGGDGYDAPAAWAEEPSIGNVYFTTHVYLGNDSPNETVREFLAAYRSAYPDDIATGFSALGYDAVGLLAAAVEASGASTPDGVLTGLSMISGYQGVTGTISFAGGTRIPTKSVTIMQVAEGEQQYVAELMPQTVPAP